MFINSLNKVPVGNIDDYLEYLHKAKFTRKSDENCPKDILHMNAENKPPMKKNETFPIDLPGELQTIEANGKISDNCKYPMALVQAAQNQKQTNTWGLAGCLN